MRNRTIITNVKPALEGGKYLIKRVPGQWVTVSADIFCDGDEAISAAVLYKQQGEKKWQEAPMQPISEERWQGRFRVGSEGIFEYKIESWINHLASWHQYLLKKYELGQNLSDDLQLGVRWLKQISDAVGKAGKEELKPWIALMESSDNYRHLVERVISDGFSQCIAKYDLKLYPSVYDGGLKVRVGRPKEQFSTWYQLFPRSAGEKAGKHGTLRDCEKRLPRIAAMGFDTLLLPPVFPIGNTNRKGRNNATQAGPNDVGSPWSVGSSEGGHKTIHPQLGSMADFERLVKAAADLGIELALDMGLRCSLDHPYIQEHPDWFVRLPDGRLRVEEVPPYNYLDIVDFDFECDDWENLWKELLSIFLFWAEKGVRIFYASTPHRKPFAFWHWLIKEVQQKYPDSIFVSGALTRPLILDQLAKAGFNQVISNLLWKTSATELKEYITQMSQRESREFLYPNFFTNTPDILPHFLSEAGPATFMLRYALAATLCSNTGVYGPVFELMHNQRFPGSKERYLNSEKYEIRQHDWEEQNKLTDFISRVNRIRKENAAFHEVFNLQFTNADNDRLLSFIRRSPDNDNMIWCVINLDDQNSQSGYLEVPKALLGLKGSWFNLRVRDLLTDEVYHWFSDWNFVELKPGKFPMHVLKIEME
jgi:starch synthase (maltosyl-transferring)